MSKIQIHSVFEKISVNIFSIRNLEEAKCYTISFIQTTEINKNDKDKMIKEINNFKTLILFQRYICNSLLKYEGLGANQYSKTARQAAADDSSNQF